MPSIEYGIACNAHLIALKRTPNLYSATGTSSGLRPRGSGSFSSPASVSGDYMRAAWSGGPLSTTHRYESQQGFSCGPVPIVPPRLDFAIGDLKDSDNRQIKWLDGVGLVPEVLDSLRYDGVRVADDRDDFKPNVPILLHRT